MTTTFRLATVERLREQAEQICARTLQQSTTGLAHAWKAREDLVEQLDGMALLPLPGDQLVMAALYRDRLREDIARAAIEVDRCSAALGEARTAWLRARAELRAVQSLHERHRQTLRDAVARQEQRELDEFAGSRRHTGRATLGGAG